MTDRAERRDVYQRVVGTVQKNTTRSQPVTLREEVLTQTVTGRWTLDQVKTAIQAAVENGDLLQVVDADGELRYAHCDRESLEALIEREVAKESPRKNVIGRCNQLLDEVDE